MTNQSLIEPYQKLAAAIVEVAIRDYRLSLRKLYRGKNKKSARYEILAAERFFRSTYFGILSDIDPEWLISTVKGAVEKEYAKSRELLKKTKTSECETGPAEKQIRETRSRLHQAKQSAGQ